MYPPKKRISLQNGKKKMNDTAKFSDSDWEKFAVWIKDLLKTDIVTVTFNKKDGTERIMKCTLNPTMLPTKVVTEEKSPRAKNENVLSVFDVESNGWRSFTLRSVKRVQFNLG